MNEINSALHRFIARDIGSTISESNILPMGVMVMGIRGMSRGKWTALDSRKWKIIQSWCVCVECTPHCLHFIGHEWDSLCGQNLGLNSTNSICYSTEIACDFV